MDDDALERRFDAVLALLLLNFVLLLGVAFRVARATAVGTLAFAALIGYGFYRR